MPYRFDIGSSGQSSVGLDREGRLGRLLGLQTKLPNHSLVRVLTRRALSTGVLRLLAREIFPRHVLRFLARVPSVSLRFLAMLRVSVRLPARETPWLCLLILPRVKIP